MPQQAEMIAYMRAWLRVHARADVALWSDEEVIESFAALRDRPVTFDTWLTRLGGQRTEAPQPQDIDDGAVEVDPETMVNIVRGNPNVKVEEHG